MILLKPDVNDLVTREDTGRLIRSTRHWSGKIRAESAAALGALRTGDAIPDLIRLLKDGQTEVREAAARALGDIGAREAVGPLIETLGALRSARNDRPGSKEYEFEAIAEALGSLNDPKGVEAVVESGTVRFHEGFFSVSRPHVAGLCLSGGMEARAALVRIVLEHYSYEAYSLVGVVEALDFLRDSRATVAFVDILKGFVELLRKPGGLSKDHWEKFDRNLETLVLAAVRALGRLEAKRAEPVLVDLLVHLPMYALHADPGDGGSNFVPIGQAFADTQEAILTIRGEKTPAAFNADRAALRLRDYRFRRHKTDVEFGGAKHRTAVAAAAAAAAGGL